MMRSIQARAGALAILSMVLIGCSSPAATGPTGGATSPSAPPPTSAPSSAAGATVEVKGAVLVAGSNGMSVYTFTKDTADSRKSACTGDCLTTWPALTVAAGGTPTAGTGISGKLGTITRADNGALQVTYNGLPLYFFSGDKAPGDLNGVYTNWNSVKP